MSAEQTQSPVLEVVSLAPAAVDPVLKRLALSRFESTFRLEGELVGKGKVRVNKKGGITLSLRKLSSKDGSGLDAATGLKGDALEACRQQMAGLLKTEYGVLATRLTADKKYEAGDARIMPNGRISLEWKPVKDETIVAISEDQAMRVLGVTPDEMAAIQLAREAKAEEDKAKVEQAKIAASAQANGEVAEVKTPATE